MQQTHPKGNQDGKRSLTVQGQARVRYLYASKPRMPENLLLHLDAFTLGRIFDPHPRKSRRASAQDRVDMLFRLVRQRLVHRGTIFTVSQTEDSMRRARGSRDPDRLGSEGIVILGHQDGEQYAAADLGLPVPRKGSLVSARVVPAEDSWTGASAEMVGRRWRLASDSDPVVPAPVWPKTNRKNYLLENDE